MHILTVVGARPQFIKAAVVSHALARKEGMRETILHTGQHFDQGMSAVFFDELGIPQPDYNLDIHGGKHGEMTGRMLEGIEQILLNIRPDCVLVYGDTNSTLAGALAAVKVHIPIAHVEAGLRSYNRRMPEEVNRILTDHISEFLFAPTETAVRNLAAEGISGPRAHLVGDVMYDAALHYKKIALERSDILERLGLVGRPYVLCTIHRAENTDDTIRTHNIFGALSRLAKDIPVILPLHPRTRSVLDKAGLGVTLSPELRIIDPVGYLDMVRLESSAALIATDSGGVQKEAYFHRVPCVTLREETEWEELVASGWNRLVPPDDPEQIHATIRAAIGSAGTPIADYGEGDAASRIVQTLNDSEHEHSLY